MTSISHIISILLVIIFLSYTNSYTILGGIEPSTTDEKDDDSVISQTLRHFENVPNKHQVQLHIQTHEASGRVSMAGTLWDGSPLLADFISNPECPLFKYQSPSSCSIVELGSGIGLASLAAAFLGCKVIATDGSLSSIRLLNENFQKYSSECIYQPQATFLEWGNDMKVDSLINDQLLGRLPDIVMASDVVYAHSARQELSQTIRRLCPRHHVNGRVVIAHRWRANPDDEELFFKSFKDDFDIEEVSLDYFPPDTYYRTKSVSSIEYSLALHLSSLVSLLWYLIYLHVC